jgi:two-component system, OmpR family, alkaline phosphatase synthesis response regulator PhoP
MTTKRILIIDDEDAIQKVVTFGITMSAPWEVLTANSGIEGILRAKVEHPDVILLDVMMPEMDGIDTFQALQLDVATQQIPVIFLTAKAQASEKRQFSDVGVDGVITKPFNSLDLVGQICKILNW